MKLVEAYDEKTLGADAAKTKLYDSLTEQATRDWPGISERLQGCSPTFARRQRGDGGHRLVQGEDDQAVRRQQPNGLGLPPQRRL